MGMSPESGLQPSPEKLGGSHADPVALLVSLLTLAAPDPAGAVGGPVLRGVPVQAAFLFDEAALRRAALRIRELAAVEA